MLELKLRLYHALRWKVSSVMHKNIVNDISPGEIGKKMLASSERKDVGQNQKTSFYRKFGKKGL
ncbi:unnamed protein product [Aphis gossypii]|uniref:Uncharacterized protein n=1 Tax=Aphis gossypii TaxID=80765 RepID=A0A9P0NGG3_APHGO|nr:unnamed protein product [Aphis gossypii]